VTDFLNSLQSFNKTLGELDRIDSCATNAAGPMKVGSGNSSTGSNLGNNLSFFDQVISAHEKLRTMSVKGVESLAVIQNNCVATEEQIFSQSNPAGVRRQDWRPRIRLEINS
jgi:hypothetical protein